MKRKLIIFILIVLGVFIILSSKDTPSDHIDNTNNIGGTHEDMVKSWPDVPYCKNGSYSSSSTKVGAIRWDAWIGEESPVGAAVERALGPSQFHYRLPFFGVETGTNSVDAKCASQECLDKEIVYARYAGLDYWAFVWYPTDPGLQQSLNLYLKSELNDEINFALIMQDIFWDSLSLEKLRGYFASAHYQTVLDNRPLFFLFPSGELTRERLDFVESAATSAGRGEPYFVYFIQSSDFHKIEQLGIDAVSMYAFTNVSDGESYSSLTLKESDSWDWIMMEGLQLVPHVTSGWDPRPRVTNPVPWTSYSADNWAANATSGEIAAHLRDALNWIRRNSASTEANTVIIYAWNEFDEGGWIAPNLEKYGGTERLDAVASIIGDC